MRPGTPHYVVTLQNSITLGHHFYATSTIRDTCWSLVHRSIMDNAITNTTHPDTEQLLRRMLSMYVRNYTAPDGVDASRSQHQLDLRTPQGLLDLVALGNSLELAHLLDRRHWEKAVPPEDVAERAHTRSTYAAFQEAFSRRHLLKIGNELHNPIKALFKPSLRQFAVTLVQYKTKMHNFDDAFTAGAFKKAIVGYFAAHRVDELPDLSQALKQIHLDYCDSFEWTGPEFSIVDRTSSHKHTLSDGKSNLYFLGFIFKLSLQRRADLVQRGPDA
jgi:hypothetical protein